MNVIVIRDQANAAAQDAFRRMVKRYIESGEWDRHLTAEWHTAEALLDMAEDRLRDMAADCFDPHEGDDALPDVPLALTPDPGDHFAWPS